MQVATKDEVFIFDLHALCHGGPSHSLVPQFDYIVETLFSNPNVIKLGFAFKQDVKNLCQSWPKVRGFRCMMGLLDVGKVSKVVLEKNNPSLSKTCEAWLGKPLDKTECISKWENR